MNSHILLLFVCDLWFFETASRVVLKGEFVNCQRNFRSYRVRTVLNHESDVITKKK